MPSITCRLAGLRTLQSDLERKALALSGVAATIIQRDVVRLKRDIVDLEAELSRHPEPGEDAAGAPLPSAGASV